MRLQKYKDGGVLDLKTFSMAAGLSWQDSADRTFTRGRQELADWIGARASAGRMSVSLPRSSMRSPRSARMEDCATTMVRKSSPPSFGRARSSESLVSKASAVFWK